MSNTPDFKKEVNSWKKEGIIEDYQAERILAKYDLAKAPKTPKKTQKVEYEAEEDHHHHHRSSKTIAVISTLGAILVGIGVILFVASNWRAIPDFAKIILLFGTTSATYFAGWKLKFDKPNYPAVGESLLLLASLFVGATIFLTAQIYNVPANSSFLILLWFLAIAPLSYALSSNPILVISILTFAGWMRAELGGYFNANFFSTMLIFLAFGISLYGAGQLHKMFEKFAKFSIIYQTVGLIYILFSFFFFSLEIGYRMPSTDLFGSFFASAIFAIFVITSIGSIVGVLVSNRSKKAGMYEFLLLLVSFFGFAVITVVSFLKDNFMSEVTSPYRNSYLQPSEGFLTSMFILFTLLLFVVAIGTILVGYYKGITPFVNIGIFFFVIGLAHIYLNTAYRFLPRSIALILGGIFLIAGAVYLEKKRRELIRNMDANE
ncbi:hypothetical protein CMO88_00235 [Candidatus Woesearchaeota archaeon]|nr:hypothetical protein [Candidatus Woesearchaeota archaeon]|tara:strand:+ start:11491 stop:12789 length:1299 start_codon:yes stop_codon:yes gene_type:complete